MRDDSFNEEYEKAIKIIDDTYDKLKALKRENKELKERNKKLMSYIDELKGDKAKLQREINLLTINHVD